MHIYVSTTFMWPPFPSLNIDTHRDPLLLSPPFPLPFFFAYLASSSHATSPSPAARRPTLPLLLFAPDPPHTTAVVMVSPELWEDTGIWFVGAVETPRIS